MEICQKCRKKLEPGEVRYQLKVELVSMYDGYVPEPEGDIDEEIDQTLAQLSRMKQKRIEADVAVGVAMVICLDCRNSLTGQKGRFKEKVFQALLSE